MMDVALEPTGKTAPLPIDLASEADDLVTWRHIGTSARLVLSFSGVGFDHRASPSYQFAKAATGDGVDNVLFIAEPKRSWLNHPGLIEKIVQQAEAMARQVGATEICTLGFSMGAYAAMVIGGFLPIKSAVAISPQYSMHPDVTGDDHRWDNWRAQIAMHRIHSVADHLMDGPIYHVFHGMGRSEHPQRDRFPVRDNLIHQLLPRVGHGVPQALRKAGQLHNVVRLGLDNRVGLINTALRPLGVRPRKMARFPILPPSGVVVT